MKKFYEVAVMGLKAKKVISHPFLNAVLNFCFSLETMSFFLMRPCSSIEETFFMKIFWVKKVHQKENT